MCFKNIIKPLQYPHITIFSLPMSQLTILEAPVIVLLGINKPIKFLEEIIDVID